MTSQPSPIPPSNIVILTSGLSGSSVLAGLISRAGYWLGNATKKIGYETYENSRLVELNRAILRASGFFHEDAGDLPPPSVDRIEAVSRGRGLDEYREFLEDCSRNEPWLWKDPRLCYTMFFWRNLHDFSDCKFILATRDSRQSWTGLVLRGKRSVPWEKYLEIQENHTKATHRFLREQSITAHRVAFEDLILDPQEVIAGLNDFLGSALTMEDFKKIYRGTVGELRWSWSEFLRARAKVLIVDRILGRGVSFPQTSQVDPDGEEKVN